MIRLFLLVIQRKESNYAVVNVIFSKKGHSCFSFYRVNIDSFITV